MVLGEVSQEHAVRLMSQTQMCTGKLSCTPHNAMPRPSLVSITRWRHAHWHILLAGSSAVNTLRQMSLAAMDMGKLLFTRSNVKISILALCFKTKSPQWQNTNRLVVVAHHSEDIAMQHNNNMLFWTHTV